MPLTNYTAGSNSLQDFQTIINESNEIESLKAAGLSRDDIKLFSDSRKGDDYLNETHKNLDKSVLQERLELIKQKIYDHCKNCEAKREEQNCGSRHKNEFALSIKPNSTETKLLQFALSNEKCSSTSIPHPMDEIKKIEKEYFGSTETLNLRKIRKKARNLQNKITRINNDVISNNCPNKNSTEVTFSLNSKWDVKDCNSYQPSTSKIVKQYSCKPQKLYTVQDGQIVEINSENHTVNTRTDGTERLSLEEIKKDPKFANYEEGEESNVITQFSTFIIFNQKFILGVVSEKLA